MHATLVRNAARNEVQAMKVDDLPSLDPKFVPCKRVLCFDVRAELKHVPPLQFPD